MSLCSTSRDSRTLVVVGCVAAFLTLSSFASPAEADDVEALAALSDAVALGTIVGTETFPGGPGGRSGIHTRVDLAVDDMLVGAPISVVSFWVQGGTYGNRRRVLEGQATFAVGERVAVFLSAAADGTLIPTGMARGKWLVVGVGDAERIAPTVAREPHAPSPATMPTAVSRATFVARVRAARGAR